MKLYLWLGGLTAAMVAAQGVGCLGAPFTLTGGTGDAGTGSSVGSGGNATTSTASLTGSSSTGGMCTLGKTHCGAACFDTNTDPHNCGACLNDCGPKTLCHMGTCACKQTGNIYCSASVGCVDPTTPEHCGGCNPCPTGDTCNSGHCACLTGGFDCGGTCTDTQVDPLNCGECTKACGLEQACVSGTCQCRGATTKCNGQCVDLRYDPGHCGSCSNACQNGDKCNNTHCIANCPMSASECNGGCYLSFNDDPANCGGCNLMCTVDQVCIGGTCQSYFFPSPRCSACPCLACTTASDTCCKVPVGSSLRVACVAGTNCG